MLTLELIYSDLHIIKLVIPILINVLLLDSSTKWNPHSGKGGS